MRIDNIRAHYDPEQTTVIHCSYKAGDSSFLGRYAEKKSFDRSNVAMQHFPKLSPYRRGTRSIQGSGNTSQPLSSRMCPDQIPCSDQSTGSERCGNAAGHKSQFSTSMPQARGLSGCPDQRLVSAPKKPFLPVCQSEKSDKAVYRSRKMPCTAYTGSIGPEAGKRSHSVRNTKIGRLEPVLSRRQGKCR